MSTDRLTDVGPPLPSHTAPMNSRSGPPAHAPLDPVWLAGRTNEELVSIMTQVSAELQSRHLETTVEVAAHNGQMSFPEVKAALTEFARRPHVSTKTPAEAAFSTWRIILASPDPLRPPLGLELFDDVTIGRLAEDSRPEIDLRPYDGAVKGVSRQHALLRPTADSLLLFDLGSANGTYCNRERATLGHPLPVNDGDVISFGDLHFKVKIVSRPGTPAA